VNYLATQTKVAAKLKKAGFAMVLSQTIPGEFDPVAGVMTDPVTQEWPVVGMKGSLGSVTRYAENTTILGTTIQAGDQLILLAAGTVIPMTGDILTIQGVGWRVLASQGVGPTDVDLFFQVHVRL
jgi:hypothetical protein